LDGKPNLPPVRTTRQRDSGPSVRIGLMRNVAPIVIRLYDPLTLIMPTQGAEMPLNLADSPACLLCEKPSHLPPSKTVWISAADSQTLGVVCGPCNELAGDELEKRILAKVSGEPAAPKIDISPPPMAAAIPVPPTRAATAAQEWVRPLAQPAA
jgi:hypothetical protein